MEEFQVKILASDHPFYEGKCYSLVIPTLRGMYGIHAHHSNMITAIIPGTLQYQIVPGAPLEAAVSNGLAKVENGEVLILVDTAERPEEIDANRARRDADAAKEAILQILPERSAACASRGAANNDKNPPYQLVWYGGFFILIQKFTPSLLTCSALQVL